MSNPARHNESAARLARELERERQQHSSNHEAKAGTNLADADRIKDARENTNPTKVRRPY